MGVINWFSQSSSSSSRRHTSFLGDIAASKVAAEAAAAARSSFAAFSRSRDKLRLAHDALMSATSAATMAQVSAASAQEAAVAQIAESAGMNMYPIMLPTGIDGVDEILIGTFWEFLRVTTEQKSSEDVDQEGTRADEKRETNAGFTNESSPMSSLNAAGVIRQKDSFI